jgi:hypothetical protein
VDEGVCGVSSHAWQVGIKLGFFYDESVVFFVDFYFYFFIYLEWKGAVSSDVGGYVDVEFIVFFTGCLCGVVQ